ncbi:MAG TPA: response regulator [Opitutaceae bacterium]|nr:response regulator [Opitutaceae bacterium]
MVQLLFLGLVVVSSTDARNRVFAHGIHEIPLNELNGGFQAREFSGGMFPKISRNKGSAIGSLAVAQTEFRKTVLVMPHAVARQTKLLLVDDRPANLLALEAVLTGPAYALIMARSGAEALALLKQHPDIALILLDVQMPEMDGFEVSRRIKESAELRDIPIIFITAIHTEDPFVKKGYESGGIDYFSKPFDPEILKLKVAIYASFRQRTNLLKERERQIKASEELLRTGRKLSTVLGNIQVGVIIADTEGRVRETNDEAMNILKSVEQTKTDSYGEFLTWWERDGHLLKSRGGPLMRALSEGRASRNEIVTIRCLDGTPRSVFTFASPLRGLDRTIVGAVVVIQDVTAHREIEEDIERRISSLVAFDIDGADRGSGQTIKLGRPSIA